MQHQGEQTVVRHPFDITAEPVQKAAQVVRIRRQAAGKARPRSFSSDRAFELQIGAAGQQHRSLGYVDAAVLELCRHLKLAQRLAAVDQRLAASAGDVSLTGLKGELAGVALLDGRLALAGRKGVW